MWRIENIMHEYVLDKVLNVLMFCVFISQVVELNAIQMEYSKFLEPEIADSFNELGILFFRK